jgi:hypothetical protein
VKVTSCLALVAALLFSPKSALSHHGWAAFSSETQITLKGTMTDFHFVNPHSVLEFKVTDEKGQIHSWEGEMASPSRLVPRGWTAASLEVGERITVTGYPAKNGSHAIRVTKIILSNGKELKLGGEN